jgi:uncharacterized membrane protein YedE/YeeE
MDLATLIEQHGERPWLAGGGLAVGLLFGFFAQRSKFCLRAATIEFWHRKFGEKLSVWLLAFSTAVVLVQGLVVLGALDTSTARQLAARGSLSGALIGGLLFGVGMVMTRGCASRLLVLSANGNLRALLSGLIFAVTAQAALSGSLAPLRTEISSWWTVEGGPARDLLAITGIGHWGGLGVGLIWFAAALFFAIRSGWGLWKWIGGIGTGLAVAAGWWTTHLISTHSFGAVQVQGLTFSGPSAEWLMRVLSSPAPRHRLRIRPAARRVCRLLHRRAGGPRVPARRLQGRLQHAPLHRRRHPDGLWLDAGRWLCRGRRHDGRLGLRSDGLDGADRHVGGRRPDGPAHGQRGHGPPPAERVSGTAANMKAP